MEQKAWIIDEKTAKQYLTVEDAIDCVEKTWKWYGEGRVIMPNKITTDMSELGVAGWFNSMPAYIGPMDVAGIKVVGGYDGNKALGLPYIKANVLITDSKTGILRALISGDHINDLRTGAQPAVMARLLAAKTDVVTIIGTGLQGYMSLLCMSKVLDMKEIRVCDISEAAMDRFIARFIARFPDAPFRFVKCKSNEEGCRGSDVIITVTNANADLVEEPWVKPGALVMTMGSFRETSFDVVRKGGPHRRRPGRPVAAPRQRQGAGGDGRDHGRLLRYHRARRAGREDARPHRPEPPHLRADHRHRHAGRRAGGRAAGKAARGRRAAARV
ncbi:MAG: ornithine cyclodeaminase family protein [Oscillospiraceae bacterium]